MNPKCRVCNIELNDKNWYPSRQKRQDYICKRCAHERNRLWRKANPEKAKVAWTRADRKRGICPFNENKECPSYLGVHIAERVLSQVFKDVKRMPMNTPGYDVICNKDKLIDIKSSCTHKDGTWNFNIARNTTADYFLCLAFDNRESLNPLHAWLLPGSKLNHLVTAAIRQSTVHKWSGYRLDISKILRCCEAMQTTGDRKGA